VRLAGREGNRLELSIVDYQFPEESVDPWDSNALLVRLGVVSPEGSWEVVDPSLTTWEAARLASWMGGVARVDAGRRIRPLAEPNVTVTAEVAAAGDGSRRVRLRACFELETRPPWLRAAAGSLLCVDVDVAPADLVAAAASLRAELARFPRRGDDPTL
jgi:hypothetical protein